MGQSDQFLSLVDLTLREQDERQSPERAAHPFSSSGGPRRHECLPTKFLRFAMPTLKLSHV
jgi:hypothetical protein